MIPGREDDPYAKKTALGWGVISVVNPTKNEEDDSYCTCHRIASLEVNPSNGKRMCHFALKTKVKEIFQPVEVMKMFETDFHEANKDGQALSHDDRNFIKKHEELRSQKKISACDHEMCHVMSITFVRCANLSLRY